MYLCLERPTNLIFNGVLEGVVGESGGGLDVGRHDGDEVLEIHQICNEKKNNEELIGNGIEFGRGKMIWRKISSKPIFNYSVV